MTDGNPWLLAEAKYRDAGMNPSLERYQRNLTVPHAFQVTVDADFVDSDCFKRPGRPWIVPARTFLAQLL